MNGEAWATVVVAAVLYAIQFGVLLGKFGALKEHMGHLEKEMTTLRENHVMHLQDIARSNRSKLMSVIKHLKMLPCKENLRRLENLERLHQKEGGSEV